MNNLNIYSSKINTSLHAFYINNVPPSYARIGRLKYADELFPFKEDESRNYVQEFVDLRDEIDDRFDFFSDDEDVDPEEMRAYKECKRRLKILDMKSEPYHDYQYFKIKPIALEERAKHWFSCSPDELFPRLAVLAKRKKLEKENVISFIKAYKKDRLWGPKEAKQFGRILQTIRRNGSVNKPQNVYRTLNPYENSLNSSNFICPHLLNEMDTKYRFICRKDPYFRRLEKIEWMLEARAERQAEKRIAYDTDKYCYGTLLERHFFIGPFFYGMTTFARQFPFEVNAHGCMIEKKISI